MSLLIVFAGIACALLFSPVIGVGIAAIGLVALVAELAARL